MDLKARAELNKLLGGNKPKEEKGKSVRSFPLTEERKNEWLALDKLCDEGIALTKQLEQLHNRVSTKRSLFWAKAEEDFGVYDLILEINVKDNCIYGYEKKDEVEEVGVGINKLLKKLLSHLKDD